MTRTATNHATRPGLLLRLGLGLTLTIVLGPASAQPPGRPGPGSGPGPGGDPLFRLLDADDDGRLSATEIARASEVLRGLVGDDDQLTPEELPDRPGPRPPVGAAGPRGRRPGPAPVGAELLEKPPVPKNEAEAEILRILDAISQEPGFRNVSTRDGRFLRQMTEALDAQVVVELGTSTGFSGLWIAHGLRTTGGHLYTHEIDPGRIAEARSNFERVGLADLITIIEGDAHQTVARYDEQDVTIDILFLDADKQGYIDYLNKLLPRVRPGGLILAHNMRYPDPDPAYLEAITSRPELETTFVLMEGAGIGLTLKKR